MCVYLVEAKLLLKTVLPVIAVGLLLIAMKQTFVIIRR